MRDDITSSMTVWKNKLDMLINDIPDLPWTNTLISYMCNPLTSKGSNSILYWIPFLKINNREWSKEDDESDTGDYDM